MPIPMTIPEQFLPAVVSGQTVRYGCILKEVATGQVVGHLKELTGLSQLLSSIPVHPLMVGATAVAQAGQWLDTHVQLRQIRRALEHLQLVSSVGAIASIVGLGVSVAGFALVWKRLQRLEQNLNGSMERLRAEVERLHLKFDLLSMAELNTARQQLDGAGHTDYPKRQAELLKDADRCFQKHRNYYYGLIEELKPLTRPTLTLPQVGELYGRFFTCAVAELEANFLLHDFAQWRHRQASIVQQSAELCALDAKEMLRCRLDALGLATQAEMDGLGAQILVVRQICQENHERLRTSETEVAWLERRRLEPAQYLRAIRETPNEFGVLFFPSDA